MIDAYAFPVTIPSTQKQITMRPYLVREEKLLLMAQESEILEDQLEAVAQVIRNCTTGQIEPSESPFFDIEYLFLQLRARSVGEVVTPIYKCNNINSEKIECGHQTELKINLSEIKVNEIPDESAMLVKIGHTETPQYTLKLKYPTVYTIGRLLGVVGAVAVDKTSGSPIDVIVEVFDYLIDHNHDDQIIKFDMYSTEDKIEFLETLPTTVYEEIIKFIVGMPTIVHNTEYTCEKCKYIHKISLSGIPDFLV